MNYTFRSLKTSLALFALAGFVLAGCDFTDGFDKDPNLADDAPADLVLTAAEVGQIQLQEGDFARLAGIFSAQFTGSDRQYSRIENAEVNTDDFVNTWNLAYQQVLAQLMLARERYEEAGDEAAVGVTETHSVLAWLTMTSLFGDIPYSQALNPDEFPNPAFDPQMEIYDDLRSRIDGAITSLQDGSGVPSGDVFGLSNDQYIGVANTIKARICLHMGEYECAEDAAENGIASPSGNLAAPHGGNDDSDANVYYYFTVVQRDGYLTANNSFAVRLLTPGTAEFDGRPGREGTDETDRANSYFDFATSQNPNSVVLNASDGGTPDDTDDDGFFAPKSDFPIVTYAENQLILAEALFRQGDEDGAREALNEARDAIDTEFGAGDDYDDLDEDLAGDDLLEAILIEKYLVLIGNIEAFNDVRRTDNFIGIPGKNGGSVPQRFLYARSELNANSSAPAVRGVGQSVPVFPALGY